MRFKSELHGNQSKIVILFLAKYAKVDFNLCFWRLSCWNMNHLLKLNFLEDSLRFFVMELIHDTFNNL